MRWHETESPWTLNKWWSKVEKWWGFPATCPINPDLPTSVSPSHSVLNDINARSLFRCHLLQSFTDRVLGTGVNEKRERERESSISRVMWKTNKAHAQDLYRSQRHRVSSQGDLESLGEKVSSTGFHVPKRMKTERRPKSLVGDPSL